MTNTNTNTNTIANNFSDFEFDTKVIGNSYGYTAYLKCTASNGDYALYALSDFCKTFKEADAIDFDKFDKQAAVSQLRGGCIDGNDNE